MRRAVFASMLALGFFASAARADEAASAVIREAAGARAEIDSTLAVMHGVSHHVRDQLRLTRKRGTATQITCVDEALSRSDVAVRRAKDAGDDALAAYARGDVENARALRRRVDELRDVQRSAARDGAACTPSPPRAARSVTTVKVVIDSTIPAD